MEKNNGKSLWLWISTGVAIIGGSCLLVSSVALFVFWYGDVPIDERGVANAVLPTATIQLVPTELPVVSTATAVPTVVPTPEPIAKLTLEEAQDPVRLAAVLIGMEPGDQALQFDISVDRSAVPDLYYSELYLQTFVGGATSVKVLADGVELASRYNPVTGYVRYETDGTDIQVLVENGNASEYMGFTQKLYLPEGKQWAWSHGLDDNLWLNRSIELFKEKGWRGTLYLAGAEIDDIRDENWSADVPAIHRILADRWSIGSHAWETSCASFQGQSLDQSFARLDEIVASSSVPDYKVIGFAAPCMDDAYQEAILELRDSGRFDVQFNEADGAFFQLLDTSLLNFEDETYEAAPLDLENAVGRDFGIEGDEFDVVQGRVDWAAAQGAEDNPIWYNTGSHGEEEDRLVMLVDYIFNTYGPAGDDSVWVAPADEIVSYFLVRDRSVVMLNGVAVLGE